MKYVCEDSLVNFKFWSGAKDTVAELTTDEIQTIEEALEEISADGEPWTDTQINDYFWFECDEIAQTLGYHDWDMLVTLRNEKQLYAWINEEVAGKYPYWNLTEEETEAIAESMERNRDSSMDLEDTFDYVLEYDASIIPPEEPDTED